MTFSTSKCSATVFLATFFVALAETLIHLCHVHRYGKIRDIDLKTPARPPAFAFIAFDDYRDAQDAIRGRDNYNFDGYRLRVEFSKGDRRGKPSIHTHCCCMTVQLISFIQPFSAGGADDRRDNRKTGGRRTEYGVIVSNLPRGCSWQDLKDFMRKAGDVVFTDVERGGDGVVEFSNRDDMEYAIKSMDDTEFKSFSDTSIIRVKAANKKRDRSEDDRDHHSSSNAGRSGRDRSASRSRSPSRDRSRSRDRAPASSKRAGSDDEDDRKERPRSTSRDAAEESAPVATKDEE